MRYQVDEAGRAGLRAHRSHELIPLPDEGCPIAHRSTPGVVGHVLAAGAELIVSRRGRTGAAGRRRAPDRGHSWSMSGRPAASWEVAADGFWQVHPAAADTLVAAVLDGLAPTPGERAFDLYCGVGLFAGALADAGCRVWGVENRQARSTRLAATSPTHGCTSDSRSAGSTPVCRRCRSGSTSWSSTRRGPVPARP